VATEAVAGGSGTESVPDLGARLRQARQRSGLSLRELARQLNVSASFVSQLENGKSQPSVATLYSITQLLGLSIDELFIPATSTTDLGEVAGPGDDASGASGAVTKSPPRPRSSTAVKAAAKDVERYLNKGSGAPVDRAAMASPANAWPDDQTSHRLSVTAPGQRFRLVMDTGVIWEQLATNTKHDLDFMEILYPAGSSSTTDDRMLRHEGFEYGILLEGELQVTFGFQVFTLRAGEALGLDSSVPHLFKNTGSVAARGIWFVHHPHG
jgi:transcriptional regulator with XRE-family HTH domain